MDDDEWARMYALAEENARLIDLANAHCRNLRFEQDGGHGMFEAETSLPLNMRTIRCPVAQGSSSSNLELIVFEFYNDHCVGCDQRDPTGQLPTLETEAQARAAQVATADAERTAERQARSDDRTQRLERRRSLRAVADPSTISMLNDLDAIDADPLHDNDAQAQRAARRRLTTVADHASDQYSEAVIDELFTLVDVTGADGLLEPLRHLASHRPDLTERLLAAATATLRNKPSIEAGRCLTDHKEHLDDADVDDSLIWAAAVLAGSKTAKDHHFSGPSPVVQANDPAPLRALADIAPDKVATCLQARLPRPKPTTLITPVSHVPHRGSDFDRRAAAGAIERLAASHLQVALRLMPPLALSLAVPVGDSYDTGTMGSAERAIGRMFVADPTAVLPMLEDGGRHASEDARKGLVGAIRHAIDMTDPEYVHRQPHYPVTSDDETQAVTDTAFTFLLARLDETWGHDVVFEAAEVIQSMTRWRGVNLNRHLDSILGAFVTLTRHRLNTKLSPLTTTATPGPMDGLEEWARQNSLNQGAYRLLRAIDEASTLDPLAVCRTISALITTERDNEHLVEVVDPLLATLGALGRQHGDKPHVVQAILPTLSTHLVHVEPLLRATALEAWTKIGRTHPLPATVEDLLPVLVNDPLLVVIDAVLGAANALPWTKPESRALLVAHAFRVMENVDVSKHLDTFCSALYALRRNVDDLEVLTTLERRALRRVPRLEWHQATRLTDMGWQPDARVSPELAQLWLDVLPQRTFGMRQGDDAEDALNSMLECGVGISGIPTNDIVDLGAHHSPSSSHASLEYAEVLARAERRTDAHALLVDALARIPNEPALQGQRARVDLGRAVTNLNLTLAPVEGGQVTDQAAVAQDIADIEATVADAVTVSTDDLEWVQPTITAAAVRAAIATVLFALDTPATIAAELDKLTGTDTFSRPAPTDPADKLIARANQLRALADAVADVGPSTGTVTHSGVVATSLLLTGVSHLLDAEASDLNANAEQAPAHRKAARQRAAAIDLGEHRDDDPLFVRARALRDQLTAKSLEPLDNIVRAAAGLPAPMLIIEMPERRRSSSPWSPPEDPDPDSETVAVALVSIDGKLLTGPAVTDPDLTHELTIQVQTDPWPDWVDRMDAELTSVLDHSELERPEVTWTRHDHVPDDPQKFEGTGSLLVRYAVPTDQHAPPVMVTLTWRGTDNDGNPKSQTLDVAGHQQFRVRPFDPARDTATQYAVFDEHLLAIYESLASAGYPHQHLQPFARLLNAVSRAGLSMTWDKTYSRRSYVKESKFHDDLHQALLDDPTLEGRVERGTKLALGFLDTRHDGITAELKVERKQAVTEETAPKYIGQPTQYAAADGARLSILVILDMSPKVLPIGTPENYLFVLTPQQHGMTEPHSPNVVVTLVVNGNLPVPSSWSRRKTPVVDDTPPEEPAP